MPKLYLVWISLLHDRPDEENLSPQVCLQEAILKIVMGRSEPRTTVELLEFISVSGYQLRGDVRSCVEVVGQSKLVFVSFSLHASLDEKGLSVSQGCM